MPRRGWSGRAALGNPLLVADAEETFALTAGRLVWRDLLADCLARAALGELTVVDQECRKGLVSVKITLALRGRDGALAAFGEYVRDRTKFARATPTFPGPN